MNKYVPVRRLAAHNPLVLHMNMHVVRLDNFYRVHNTFVLLAKRSTRPIHQNMLLLGMASDGITDCHFATGVNSDGTWVRRLAGQLSDGVLDVRNRSPALANRRQTVAPIHICMSPRPIGLKTYLKPPVSHHLLKQSLGFLYILSK